MERSIIRRMLQGWQLVVLIPVWMVEVGIPLEILSPVAEWGDRDRGVPPGSAAIISTNTLSRVIVPVRTITTILITIATTVVGIIPAGVTRPIGATLCTSCDRIRAPYPHIAADLSCFGLRCIAMSGTSSTFLQQHHTAKYYYRCLSLLIVFPYRCHHISLSRL